MQERYELKTIMMEFLQRMNCSPSQVMKFLQKKKKEKTKNKKSQVMKQ